MVNNGFTYRTINYGGVNKMFLWLGNALANEGYKITFCCIHDTEKSDRISANANSIELAVPAYTSYFRKHLSFLYHATKELNKVIKNGKYDYVMNFDGMAFYVLLFLRLFHSFKFVVSERADPNYNQSGLASIKRKLYRYVDILVCQTEGAKGYFSMKIQRKSTVIPNPVDIPREEWNISATKKEIAHVARLHIWQKRQDVLLHAFADFINKHPDYKLNIYGGGPDEEKLQSLAKELNILHNVIFHGNTKDVKEKLLRNEMFVLSSDFEGMPNALMEAMALGMPVVSTKCSPGGAEALISNGENGLLVECGDSQGLCKALCDMVENNEQKLNMAKQARLSMKDYEPKQIISLWEQILN